ncbi:Copper amine oxidase N-terminal domain-containing protein [Paenibacillus sp. 1_12]|uniref:stalk domain-containing protein n=1 Tax=Paenibacillus sp. 1_12 TaxID=1566278 RepID=UPI0008EB5610|nr:stalk domain-containing protein [Paenibacillus sp. 1_12]SFM49704.1 Copper amine oxidase N-terminal domain-containing protein [Paenibacillus sp. 1_12]
MKKFVLGLTLGIALTATTVVYASDTIQAVRQVFINGQLLNTNVQVSDDGTTMTSTRTLAEALGAKVSWNGQSNTVEIENQYPYFVSSLLHGKYSFKYEIIADNIINNPDTTVVFSEGYKDIPDNTDFQKLFLLLLIEQIGDLKNKKIEFWSNKEHALAYVSGNYKEDGIEGSGWLEGWGWLGMNSRFGLLIRDGEKVSLSHILSTHERDVISFGKYKE